MLTAREAVSILQDRLGASRGETLDTLKRALDVNDPELENVDKRELGLLIEKEQVKSLGLNLVLGLAEPVFDIAGILGSKRLGSVPEKLREEMVSVGPKVLGVPLASGAAYLAGSLAPFGLAERAVAAPAGLLARGLAKAQPGLFKALRAGVPVAGKAIETGLPAIRRAATYESFLRPAAAIGGLTAIETKDPTTAVVAGLAGGLLGAAAGKLLNRLRGVSKVDQALEYIARIRNDTIENVRSDLVTYQALRSELERLRAPMGVVPKPIDVLSDEEIARATRVLERGAFAEEGVAPARLPRPKTGIAVDPKTGVVTVRGYHPVYRGGPAPGQQFRVGSIKGTEAYVDSLGEDRIATFVHSDVSFRKPYGLDQPVSERTVNKLMEPDNLRKLRAQGYDGILFREAKTKRIGGVALDREAVVNQAGFSLYEPVKPTGKIFEQGRIGWLGKLSATRAGEVIEDMFGSDVLKRTRKAFSELTEEEVKRQRGAFFINPPKKPEAFGFGGEESRFRSLNGRAIVVGANVSPEETILSDPLVRQYVGDIEHYFLGTSWRIPLDVFGRYRESAAAYLDVVDNSRKMLMKKAPSLMRRTEKILVKHGITDKNFDEFIRHVEGLRRGGDGSLAQTAEEVNPLLDKAAREFRTRVTDPIYKLTSGIDPRAPAIFREHGIYTPGDLRVVMGIQQGIIPRNVKFEQLAVAERTRGMLNPLPWQDTSIIFNEGYYTHRPVEGALGKLLEQKASLERQVEMGLGNDSVTLTLSAIDKKIKNVIKLQEELVARGESLPMRDVLPRKQWYGPLNATRDPRAKDLEIDKDVPSVMKSYIFGSMTKAHHDFMLWSMKGLSKELEDAGISDPILKGYITDWVNAMRGVKGFRENVWAAETVNAIGKKLGFKPVSEGDIANWAGQLLKFQAYTKLFLSLRFPLMNSTQTMVTLWPLVDGRVYGSAVARTVANADGVWRRALAAGVISKHSAELAERFLAEAGAGRPTSKIGRAIAFLPTFTEDFNRVVSFEAGRQTILRDLQPSKLVQFVGGKGLSKEALANRYGVALVNRTQFILSSEGRPLAFVGGSTRRLATQFKTFMVAYGTLFKDAYLLGVRKGEWSAFGKMLTSVYMLGGLPAFGAAIPFYDQIRRQVIKHTGIVLPEGTGITQVSSALGLGFRSPIDIQQSVSPFSAPREVTPGEIFRFAAGPTLAAPADILGSLASGGPRAGVRAAIRAVSPAILSVGESITEARQGGLRTASGMPAVFGRSRSDLLARLGNLARSPLSTRADYIMDAEAAFEGGYPDVGVKILAEARKQGFVIGPRTISAIKARITKRRKGGGLGDVFGR